MSLRSLNISVDREGRDRDRHLRCVDKLGKILNLVQSEDSYLVIGGEKKREKAKAAVMIQTEKIYKEVCNFPFHCFITSLCSDFKS